MGRAGRGGNAGGGFRGGGHGLGGLRGGGSRIGGHPDNSRGGRDNWGQGSSNRSSGGGYYRRPFFMSPFWGFGRSYYGRGPSGCTGLGGGLGGCLMPILLIGLLFFFFNSFSSVQDSAEPSGKEISQSSYQREPIEYGLINQTTYYHDELGWIKDQNELTEGLEYFQDSTNIQPYIYITGEINGNEDPSPEEIDQYAHELYDKLFTDEAHLLLLFFENEKYEYHHSYHTVYGVQAKKVMDSEAEDILFDCLDYYYTSDMSEDQYFSSVFSETAERIMYNGDQEDSGFPWLWIILAGIIIGGALLLPYIKSRKMKAKKVEPASNQSQQNSADFEDFDF